MKVVGCYHCGNVQATAAVKYWRCAKCGKRVNVKKCRVFARGLDAPEACRVAVNARGGEAGADFRVYKPKKEVIK